MREYFPDLNHLTDREKDALMVELWEEIQQLRARVKEVEQRFAVLEAALNLHPTHPHGIRLQKRYAALKEHLFLFLEDASIPPTNNQSERDLRMSKIFRKVTNGFRSTWGRDLFTAVRSVANTGKRHGFNAFEAITKALSSALPDFLFKPG